MAKTSWINRNERKRATVKKYAALRAELKAKKDYMALSQLPRDASPTRVVNRCEVSGDRCASTTDHAEALADFLEDSVDILFLLQETGASFAQHLDEHRKLRPLVATDFVEVEDVTCHPYSL